MLKFKLGYFLIDKFKEDDIPEFIRNKLPKDLKEIKKNFGNLFINVVENHYYFYPKLIEYIDEIYSMFDKMYVELDIKSYLKSIGSKTFDIPTIKHITDLDKGERFKLIYESNIKRV